MLYITWGGGGLLKSISEAFPGQGDVGGVWHESDAGEVAYREKRLIN